MLRALSDKIYDIDTKLLWDSSILVIADRMALDILATIGQGLVIRTSSMWPLVDMAVIQFRNSRGSECSIWTMLCPQICIFVKLH